MSWFGRRVAFPYPTSATFVAQVCLGVALTLGFLGAVLHFGGFGFPAFWLAAPAALAFVAAGAMGPGMREEFYVDPEARALGRRVCTLWVPKDEEIFPRAQLRLAAVARPRDEAGHEHPAYVVLIDQRGRWLTLAHTADLGRARRDRDRVARGLGIPPVEVRCGMDWFPYWGRIQPPPPPEAARLPEAGAEFADAPEPGEPPGGDGGDDPAPADPAGEDPAGSEARDPAFDEADVDLDFVDEDFDEK